jgi:hypothetical protein
MSYTKGEWKSSKVVIAKKDWFEVNIGNGEKRLAETYGDSSEEAEANAKLIAAAPELLEALKGSYELLTEIYEKIPMRDRNMLERKAQKLFHRFLEQQVMNERTITKAIN